MSDSTKALALLPTDSEWAKLKEIGISAFKSGLIPTTIKTPEAATIIALKGYELGLQPMVAFAHMHVVNGKPGCSAELLLAGIRKAYPKVSIQYVESSDKICKIKVKRPDEDFFNEFQFTIDEAKVAGLLGKDVWKAYPTDMLRARAITRMKRALFPEVMMGLDHTAEELEPPRDVTPQSNPPPLPPNPPGGGEIVIQTFGQESAEEQAAQPVSEKPKNVAPQTAEEAKAWRPGDTIAQMPKNPPAEEAPPQQESQGPKARSRNEIGAEIGKLGSQLGLKPDALIARVEKLFAKSHKQITSQEMEIFCEMLRKEVEDGKPATAV